MRKKLKKFFKITFIFLFIIIFSIFFTDWYVKSSTSNKIFSEFKDLPKNKVGLLLGTSKRLSNGNQNLFYKYRIDAAVKLFKAGKIDFILASGDNSTKFYNEPKTMKNDLIKRGIPEEKIILDYAGFRTLDSVVRCKKVFGQDKFTIISQKFHNERALFIAKNNKIKAVGYNAKAVNHRYGFKTMVREKLARVKMMLDFIFDTSPKFLGETIQIG